MTATTTNTDPSIGRRVATGVGLAAALSVAVNVAIYVIARAADVDLLVPDSPGSDELSRLGAGPVVISSIVPLVIAAGVALGLRRWASRPTRIFQIVVAVGFVLSYVNVVTSDLSGETAVAVGLMHPIVAIAAWWFLTPLADPERR